MTMILLAALGFFVFTVKTVPFQTMSRSSSWRHPHQQVVGGMPPSQYTGEDPEEITIEAELRPEVTGGLFPIAMLHKMAGTGRPYPLITGSGEVLGSYVITGIQEKRSELKHTGSPRAIAFTLNLKKVSDVPIGTKGKALLLGLGLVRNLTGV